MRLIDADELKSKKEYSAERHEWVVSVAAIDWMNTIDAVPVVHAHITCVGFRFYCSNCGESTDIGNNYCHSCGARMDAEAPL